MLLKEIFLLPLQLDSFLLYIWNLYYLYIFSDLCFESLYPSWDRYFLHGRQMKYAPTEDSLNDDVTFHYRYQFLLIQGPLSKTLRIQN